MALKRQGSLERTHSLQSEQEMYRGVSGEGVCFTQSCTFSVPCILCR